MYFERLEQSGIKLSEHKSDLNPWAVGCYTSQQLIKKKYRQLENDYFRTEKMVSHACMCSSLEYPRKELDEALYDLLFAQFHDYLTGTSTEPVEEMGIRKLDHGIEILSRVRNRAFISLAGGQKNALPDEIPILVYNPHPYPVEDVFECEFMLWDQNWSDKYYMPKVYDEDGNLVNTQPEKENSNIPIDWRKKVSFRAVAKPMQITRFNCKFDIIKGSKPEGTVLTATTHYIFNNKETEVRINRLTGLVDSYRVNGTEYLKQGSFELCVLNDNCDPWGMTVSEFKDAEGVFGLLKDEEAATFCKLEKNIPSVRIVESGSVRTVIEAVFGYGNSKAVVRYKMNKTGTALDIDLRIDWNEKQKMIKMKLPTAFEINECIGQVVYGLERLPMTGRENVSQRFNILCENNDDGKACILINNGVYGSSTENNIFYQTLLRSPAYTAHPLGPDRKILPQDRFTPHCDIGERSFSFRFDCGKTNDIIKSSGRNGAIFNEKCVALSFFPPKQESKENVIPGVILDGDGQIEMTAFKKAENSDEYIIRLFNPLEKDAVAVINIPAFGIEAKKTVKAFEFMTYVTDKCKKTLNETDLMEGM